MALQFVLFGFDRSAVFGFASSPYALFPCKSEPFMNYPG
jgi:hypothetical protein